MANTRLVVKNMILLFSKRMMDIAMLFFFTMYIARHMGVEEFGRYSFAFSFTLLFLPLSDLGLYFYVNREVAKGSGYPREMIGNVFSLKILLSIISLIAIVSMINLLGYESQTKMIVYIAGTAMVLSSFLLLFAGIFRGTQRVDLEFFSTFLEKPLYLILGFFALRFGLGLLSIVAIMAVVRLFTLLITISMYSKNYGPIELRVNAPADCIKLLKDSLSYGIFFALGIFYFNIDTVMLSYIKGDAAVGIYQASRNFMVFLMIVPDSILDGIFPRMTECFYNSKTELNILYNRVMKMLAFFGFPILAFLIFFKDFIMNITFGNKYADSAAILPIMGLVVIFRFLASGTGTLITATGRQSIRTGIVLAGTVLTILLNIFLIPVLGYFGAALTALVTNIFLLMFYSAFAEKRLSIKLDLINMLKLAASFFAMSIFLIITTNYSIWLRAPVSLCVFLISAWYLRILKKDEIEILKGMFFENKVEEVSV